jgi:hypothetical protein
MFDDFITTAFLELGCVGFLRMIRILDGCITTAWVIGFNE